MIAKRIFHGLTEIQKSNFTGESMPTKIERI